MAAVCRVEFVMFNIFAYFTAIAVRFCVFVQNFMHARLTVAVVIQNNFGLLKVVAYTVSPYQFICSSWLQCDSACKISSISDSIEIGQYFIPEAVRHVAFMTSEYFIQWPILELNFQVDCLCVVYEIFEISILAQFCVPRPHSYADTASRDCKYGPVTVPQWHFVFTMQLLRCYHNDCRLRVVYCWHAAIFRAKVHFVGPKGQSSNRTRMCS